MSFRQPELNARVKHRKKIWDVAFLDFLVALFHYLNISHGCSLDAALQDGCERKTHHRTFLKYWSRLLLVI
jgi:hypothetical protein